MKVASYLLLISGLVCSETSSSQNQNSATGSGQRIVVIDSGISRDEAESQNRITQVLVMGVQSVSSLAGIGWVETFHLQR